MLRKFSLRKRKTVLVLCIVIAAFLLILPQMLLIWHYNSHIFSLLDMVPNTDYAIVFATTVNPDATLTDITKERIEAAVMLYKQSKVKRIFVSGDKRHNDEAQNIADYAIRLGVSSRDIDVDDYGIDTFQTCQHFSKIANQAILITQRFHLPRALFLCEQFKIQATGLAVDDLGILQSRGDSLLEIVYTRVIRFLKESISTWFQISGLYGRFNSGDGSS
jgi:vancomycin permeability regulator SanA